MNILLREQRYKEQEEKELKEEEEKLAELRKDPYTEEIGECKKLIRYLGLFLDNSEENKQQDPTKTGNGEAQDEDYLKFTLSSLGSEVTRKRDNEDENIFGGEGGQGGKRRGKGKRRRRNRKRNRNTQDSAKKENDPYLPLHPQDKVVLFEKFKILEPSRKDQIDGTIKLLNEKIEYYK